MNILTRIQHSLSAKLLVLFLCAGALILLLVGLIVGQGFSQQFRSSTQPIILQYVTLMQQELGSPPMLEAAQRITHKDRVAETTRSLEGVTQQITGRSLALPSSKSSTPSG